MAAVNGSDPRDLSRLETSFGSRTVAADARRRLVRDLFDRVAPRYDLMNDLMSLGLHRLWKRTAAAAAAAAAQRQPGAVVDLAGGTGDLSRRVAARLPDRFVVNLDASPGMLAVAAQKPQSGVGSAVAEAERLPLADASVAAVMLAFGLRNMTEPRLALREIHRALKPGGALVLLEFSTPASWFAPFYSLYSRLVIPALGAAVARDRRAYRYLVESIRRFPDAETVTAELRAAGFERVTVRRLAFGIAALHVADKT